MLGFQVLDKRHKGHGTFVYRVQITGPINSRMAEFNKVRQWCWGTFGPSCERDYYAIIKSNAPWSWHVDDEFDIPYIYIANNDAESLFKLKWM